MPFDNGALHRAAPWGVLPGDADIVAPLDRVRGGTFFDSKFFNYRREPARLTLLARRRAMPAQTRALAAERLDRYFRFRAARQSRPYCMSPRFFAKALADGQRDFFGVLVDDRGEILEDAQRPEVLKAFRRSSVQLADAAE